MIESGRSRALALGAAAACALLGAALFFAQRPSLQRAVTYAGTPIVPPKSAADAMLIDQNGAPAHLIAPGYDLTFLFFGYTHCPDECPLALASLGKAYRALAPDRAARTRVVFVTVDPERDVPAVMRRYVASFDPHFTGLSGSRAQLAPVWAAYGVKIDRVTREIAHGDAIYAIDATRSVVLIYPPDAAAADLAADAVKLTAPG
jgi:protein SCO1/2